MSGLDLINTYSSDSNDDEEIQQIQKIEKILPLPQSIVNWKGVSHHDNVIDDSSQHEGRSRSFKHERGNWATLIYVTYAPSESMVSWIKSIILKIPVEGIKIYEQYHISLTRTLILKFHWIDSFVDSVKKSCFNATRFEIELNDLKIYCNEERTRTFIGISCQDDSGTLRNFVSLFDNILADYQLPPFYQDPSFHISIFWCLGDKEESLKQLLPLINDNFHSFLTENIENNYAHVDHLFCKIGNRLYNFKLK